MTRIYEQHDKAFKGVSAFIIAREGVRVATVAIKFPADGASRLYAYVHWLGLEMVRGSANGYGYDKRSAAVSNALTLIKPAEGEELPMERDNLNRFIGACLEMDSQDWTRALEKAGFTVWQAV